MYRMVIRWPLAKTLGRIGRAALQVLRYPQKQSCENGVIAHELRVPGYRNTFGGYYDRSPFRPSNANQTIVHANNMRVWRRPSPGHETSVLLVDVVTGSVLTELGRSYAWNWQQGCKAMWFSDNVVVYNQYCSRRDDYESVFVNVNTGERVTWERPVQDVTQSRYAVSINYSALHYTRPDYGYRNRRILPADIHEGALHILDFREQCERKLLGVKELVAILELPRSLEKQRINHVLFSPSGDKFVFLFRGEVQGKRQHFLMLYDLNGDRVRCLLRGEVVSHYSWVDNHTLLFWGSYCGAHGYHFLDTNVEGGVEPFVELPDGHPFCVDEHIVVDTYPDRTRHRRLYRVDPDTSVATLLFSQREPVLLQGETRCDLHPKVSSDGSLVQVDCSRGGRRFIMVIGLSSSSN